MTAAEVEGPYVGHDSKSISTHKTVHSTPTRNSNRSMKVLPTARRTRQQTLTQIDFVIRCTPDEDVDLEFDDGTEPRVSKKRRTSSKSRRSPHNVEPSASHSHIEGNGMAPASGRLPSSSGSHYDKSNTTFPSTPPSKHRLVIPSLRSPLRSPSFMHTQEIFKKPSLPLVEKSPNVRVLPFGSSSERKRLPQPPKLEVRSSVSEENEGQAISQDLLSLKPYKAVPHLQAHSTRVLISMPETPWALSRKEPERIIAESPHTGHVRSRDSNSQWPSSACGKIEIQDSEDEASGSEIEFEVSKTDGAESQCETGPDAIHEIGYSSEQGEDINDTYDAEPETQTVMDELDLFSDGLRRHKSPDSARLTSKCADGTLTLLSSVDSPIRAQAESPSRIGAFHSSQHLPGNSHVLNSEFKQTIPTPSSSILESHKAAAQLEHDMMRYTQQSPRRHQTTLANVNSPTGSSQIPHGVLFNMEHRPNQSPDSHVSLRTRQSSTGVGPQSEVDDGDILLLSEIPSPSPPNADPAVGNEDNGEDDDERAEDSLNDASVTMSQLLPDSLMNSFLPAPPFLTQGTTEGEEDGE